jgi:hypothetical protein
MTRNQSWRLLALILRPSADLAAFALIVCAVALWDSVYRPRFFDECYALALVFQMFAACTGFRDRAVRGHFDILLTRSHRLEVAGGHLAMSAMAGVLVWLFVTATDAVILQRLPTGAAIPGVAAFICVSLIGWGGGLALPRYGAGVLWLLLVVVVGGSGYASRVRTNAFSGSPTEKAVARTIGFLAAPMLLVSDAVPPSAALVAVIVLGAVAGAAGGFAYVARFDARLQEVG